MEKYEEKQTGKLSPMVTSGGFSWDRDSRRVFTGEKEINFSTAKEFDLLELLACNPEQGIQPNVAYVSRGNKAMDSAIPERDVQEPLL